MKPKRFPAILLMGPTGSGKTPLGIIAASQGVPGHTCHHFDFGAQLRRIDSTPEANGIQPRTKSIVREVLETGRLLDEQENYVALDILQQWLAHLPETAVVILNGLPRTLSQADIIRTKVDVCIVVELEASDEMIHTRIADNSGGDRTERVDDHPEKVQKRLQAYRKRTMPLREHYRKQNAIMLRFLVDTKTAPEKIWQTVRTNWESYGLTGK
jgi:adenylate kinase family enzyme